MGAYENFCRTQHERFEREKRERSFDSPHIPSNVCPMCHGRKMITIMTSYKGDTQEEKEVACFGCSGTGIKVSPSNINSAMRFIG